MACTWIIVGFLFICQDQVPFKPDEHFELKLDYTFKQRPVANGNLLEQRPSGGLLPYLVIQLKLLTQASDESRFRISTNTNDIVTYKKIRPDDEIKVDMGFTADMKDRVTPHQYTITFLSSDKEEKSRIVISVDEDGAFFVNGKQRGKL